jgi:hypothetical protein
VNREGHGGRNLEFAVEFRGSAVVWLSETVKFKGLADKFGIPQWKSQVGAS